MKRKKSILLALIISCITLSGCSSISEEDYNKLLDNNLDLQAQCEQLQEDNLNLLNDKKKVEDELEVAQNRISQFSSLEEKYKGLSESEIVKQQAANELKAEQDRKEKERLLAVEKEKAEAEAAQKVAAAEAEAKRGYNTGITYSQLARTPDDYVGKKVKFTGKVIQVVDGGNEINLRVAINNDYDSVILVYYSPNITNTRVLDNDTVTLYGVSNGLHTYESTMGGNITVPLVGVDKIEIAN